MLNPLTNELGDNLENFTTNWPILKQLGILLFEETPKFVSEQYKGKHVVVTDCAQSALINSLKKEDENA